mgnify:CR=1 FL=1
MEEYYLEPQRKIRIRQRTQVLVVGAGPAGVAAAICAAREGAKVLLIEQKETLGGVSTVGLMSHFTGSVNSRFYREVLARQKLLDGRGPEVEDTVIDTEMLKIAYVQMLEESGAEMLLNTVVSDAICKDGKVEGVIIESKAGREAAFTDIVIDCSGDGDVAAKAGAEFFLGRESDGKQQPATLMLKLGGVDDSRAIFPWMFEAKIDTPKGEIQTLASRELPFPMGHVLLYRTNVPGLVTCNMTNCIGIDGTKTEDLTRAESVCRKQIYDVVQFLREYAPGYENCYAVTSASLMGIRETRHFRGEYVLTERDIYEARMFDDWVVKDAHFNFDIHNLSGSGLDETGLQKEFKQTKGYEIPYRCLLPKSTENVLLAGRCISGTHLAHSSYRAMPICMAMGEGAGYAAAISVKRNIPLRAVNVREIQTLLGV